MTRLKPPKSIPPVSDADKSRFERFVDRGHRLNDCWLWTGHKNSKGYGQFRLKERAHWAHRVAYRIFNGPIPDGMQIHHTCANVGCVNPAHLEPLTPTENSLERHARHNGAAVPV